MSELLRLEGVGFCYPKGLPVFENVNISLSCRDTVALMGANGSGKTTLGKVMLGLLAPTSGRVLLEGKEVGKWPLAKRGSRIGYVFQNPEKQLFCPTVAEEIGFALSFQGLEPDRAKQRVEEMLARFDLAHCRDSFPFNLSQGEKQRLVLAGVMALAPDFVILDEPTTGLDRARKQVLADVLKRLADRGVGYVLISHDWEFCRSLCRRLLVLEEGACHEEQF